MEDSQQAPGSLAPPEKADHGEWLNANRQLRMDANSPLFREGRRRFHIARYEFAKTYCRDKRVLDAACGTGYGTAILGSVARHAVGIDFSDEAVSYAASMYAATNVSFGQGFVEATDFQADSFDVVTSFETVEHTLCPHSHMAEIVRLLRPVEGIAILSVPNAWGLKDHHFFDFDVAFLTSLTSAHFGETDLFYQNPESHRHLPGIGPLQSGAHEDAECIVAVCRRPQKTRLAADRQGHILREVYENAFRRHRDYLALLRERDRRLWSRIVRKLGLRHVP